jgi:excisionase family DNA binding protein
MQQATDPDTILLNDIPRTSKRLGLCASKVYGLIREGRLKVTKIGRRTFISEAALLKFIADCDGAE